MRYQLVVSFDSPDSDLEHEAAAVIEAMLHVGFDGKEVRDVEVRPYALLHRNAGSGFGIPDPVELAQHSIDSLLRRKWSRQDIARAVGVSRRAVFNWERGRSVPSLRHRELLAGLISPISGRNRCDHAACAGEGDIEGPC